MITAVNEVLAAPDDDPPVAAKAAITGAAGRDDLEVGFVYDSADDSARVTLVHSYAGTKTVIAYADDDTTNVTGTKANTVTIGADADAVDHTLKAASGTFLEADGLTVVDDAEDVAGTIAAGTKPNKKVSYYEADGEKTYVRHISEVEDADGDTLWTYRVINIRTGAKIPGAAPYTHLHFGVWAGLEEAAKNGDNNIADLGIGFVTALADGTGMTGGDMPNNGSAEYTGNWVANVQAADDAGSGDITLQDGAATIEANFGKDEVKVMLTDLATLEGAIAGNQFSGTKATIMPTAAIEGGLDVDDKFAGSFEGAFYGSKAAEAGGVFAYTSKDNEGGAFTGAFGGDRDPE